MIIRPADLADAPDLARLSEVLGYPAGPDEVARRLASLRSDPSQLVLVAERPEGGGLAAWLAAERRLTLESGTRFEIVGLVVDPAARRSGVGTSLVRAAESWVLGQGGTALGVRSNVLRPESHGFYESLGFLRRKTQHVYHKDLTA